MKKLLLLLLPARIVIWSFVAFIAWQVGVFLLPKPAPYTEDQHQALARASESLAATIAPSLDRPACFGVIHLWNDGNDEATAILKATLASRRSDWTVLQESVIHRFLSDVGKTVSEASSLDELVNAGRRVKVDVVLAGRVADLATSNRVSHAALDILACDVQAGRVLFKGRVEGDWTPGPLERLARWIRQAGAMTRLLVWLAFVLILPWVTPFGTRWAVEAKSNAASFALVATYTVLGLALAVVLSGFTVSGGWAWARLLLAFAFGAGYSFWVCERLAAEHV